MSKLGSVLANLRKSAGLSQSELAHRAQMSGGYLSQLETGVRGDRVPVATLERLAKALGVDRKVLLDASESCVNRLQKGATYRPTLEDFIETEPTLNPDQKSFLLNLIGYLRASSERDNPSLPREPHSVP